MMNNISPLGLIIWGFVELGLGGLGVYLLLSSLRAKRDAKESLSWPTVAGEVTDVRVNIDGDPESGKYRFIPIVKYAYEVNSRIFDNDKITFGQGPIFTMQQTADDFLKQFPPGAEVKVYYHPEKPHKAVLKQEALGTKSGMISGIVVIALTFFMTGTLLFFLLLMG